MKQELRMLYGFGKEDAGHFVKGFEIDCIVQGILDKGIMLQLFKLCLQGYACKMITGHGLMFLKANQGMYVMMWSRQPFWHIINMLRMQVMCGISWRHVCKRRMSVWILMLGGIPNLGQVVCCIERPGTSAYAEEASFCSRLAKCFEVEG